MVAAKYHQAHQWVQGRHPHNKIGSTEADNHQKFVMCKMPGLKWVAGRKSW